jgi:Mn-dependent DtxR family transcriptional regulator
MTRAKPAQPERQLEALRAIARLIETAGCSPTLAELAVVLKLSTAGAYGRVLKLDRDGLVVRGLGHRMLGVTLAGKRLLGKVDG